jgi:hypothetical protein
LRSCQRPRGELHVRRLEGGEERPLVGRVQRHDRRRPRVGADGVVHREQPMPTLDVPKVLVVKRELRRIVGQNRNVEHIHRARSSQLRPVHQFLRLRRAVKRQPILYAFAVPHAKRMCPCSEKKTHTHKSEL